MTTTILLKEKREAAGLSQAQLSAKSGVPQQTISSIESMVRQNPGVETVWLLAKALGCRMDELYRPDGERAG